MIIPQEYKYSKDPELSSDEQEVINEFLNFYRNQSVIVADEYSQFFDIVPLKNDRITFKTSEEEWKSVHFCKRIFHKGKFYIVELLLARVLPRENDPKCLCMDLFRIITDKEVHSITLDTADIVKRKIMFNIVSIFDEKKIISPAQAYTKQMYTNTALQGFIENHEWQNIDTGIQQMPELVNALFIVREGFSSASHYTADFGTILYQLLSFRMNNLDTFDEKDLKQLDELILKLRKTQLLKVQLHECIYGEKTCSSNSILLESINYSNRIHSSQQYTVDNTELLGEQKVLDQCVKSLNLKHK